MNRSFYNLNMGWIGREKRAENIDRTELVAFSKHATLQAIIMEQPNHDL